MEKHPVHGDRPSIVGVIDESIGSFLLVKSIKTVNYVFGILTFVLANRKNKKTKVTQPEQSPAHCMLLEMLPP